jgi:hypothetical protein
VRFHIREAAERAFRLAYFIHLDRLLAVRITTQALSGLDTRIARQRKRLYYFPRRKVRTKVSLDEMQELQRLVFWESEACEKQQEQAGCSGLGGADWLIRFVKHLVAITVERSAFYVALGLSRLLFSYSTAETVLIYDVVRQDAEPTKHEPYFRKQKIVLMKQMKGRFGAVLQTRRVGHGHETFVTTEASERHVALVGQCLDMFTPWDTRCVLPERFDPVSDTIIALRFDGKLPDAEHPVEARRMHTLIHLDCYERLVTALGFASPARQLSVPVFFCTDADDEGHPPGGGRLTSGLSEKEFSEIVRSVKENASRRRRAAPASLSVKVDGEERATLGLDDPSPVRLIVGGDARMVEVSGRDEQEEILLAHFLLNHGELCRARPSKKYHFRLAHSRELSLTIFPRFDTAGEVEGADLELDYLRVETLGVIEKFIQTSRAHGRPALAFGTIALALLIAVGLWTVSPLFRRNPSTNRPASEYVARVDQPPTQPNFPAPDGPVLAPGRGDQTGGKNLNGAVRRNQGSKKSPGPQLPTNAAGRAEREGMTSEGGRALDPEAQAGLLSVRHVYVEEHPRGSDAALRDNIKNLIAASQRLSVSEEPQQADAFLLWSLSRSPEGRQVKGRLIDRQGRQLWGASRPVTGAAGDKDAASRASSKLVQGLLDEIARREGVKK